MGVPRIFRVQVARAENHREQSTARRGDWWLFLPGNVSMSPGGFGAALSRAHLRDLR